MLADNQLRLNLTSAPPARDQAAFAIQGPYADSTRGTDKDVSVLVVGGGDIYKKLLRGVYDHRGTKRYIFDIDKTAAARLQSPRETILDNLDRLPEKTNGKPEIDYVLVLTPGGHHLASIKWAFDRNLPVVVEKPTVVGRPQIVELEALLNRPHPPLYCIDWAIEQAKPLLFALGSPVSFADSLVSDFREAKFDLKSVVSLSAAWLHHQSTTDLEAYQNRKWANDLAQGGGQLVDNGVHILNSIAAAGLVFDASTMPVAYLGTKTSQRGEYAPAGKDEIEEYVRIEGKMGWRHDVGLTTPNGGIRALLEIGWNATADKYIMELADRAGARLRWVMSPSRVEYIDQLGRVEKEVALKDSDTYDRVIEHATRFVLDPKNSNEGMYAAEQLGNLKLIANMQETSRSQPVRTGHVIRQSSRAELSHY